MGVLAPGSLRARPIDTSRNFPAHMSTESPSTPPTTSYNSYSNSNKKNLKTRAAEMFGKMEEDLIFFCQCKML